MDCFSLNSCDEENRFLGHFVFPHSEWWKISVCLTWNMRMLNMSKGTSLDNHSWNH